METTRTVVVGGLNEVYAVVSWTQIYSAGRRLGGQSHYRSIAVLQVDILTCSAEILSKQLRRSNRQIGSHFPRPISFPHSLRPTEILLPHLSIVV